MTWGTESLEDPKDSSGIVFMTWPVCSVHVYILGLGLCPASGGWSESHLCPFQGSPLNLQIESICFPTWPDSPTYERA